MIDVYVTYDASIFKWVIYSGWNHFLHGDAWQVDEWLLNNRDKYIEIK